MPPLLDNKKYFSTGEIYFNQNFQDFEKQFGWKDFINRTNEENSQEIEFMKNLKEVYENRF